MNCQLLCEQAAVLQRSGKIPEAESLYLKVLSVEPEHSSACQMLGEIRLSQGRDSEAQRLTAAGLQRNPNSPDLLILQAQLLQKKGQPNQALTALDRALRAKPDHPHALIIRGNILGEAGRYSEAIEAYDKVIARTGGNVDAIYNRAYVLGQIGDYAAALAGFTAVSDVAPTFVPCWINTANILRKLGRSQEALKSFDTVLAITPNSAETWVSRGDTLNELRRVNEALLSYDRAVKLSPDFPEAWNNRGNALLRLRRVDEALSSYQKALDYRPDFAEALFNRGSVLWVEKREYESAFRDIAKAAAINPNSVAARKDLLFHLKAQRAEWGEFEQDITALMDGIRTGKGVVEPFVYAAVSDQPGSLQACAVRYAKRNHPGMPKIGLGRTGQSTKIRLGYLSGEFRAQATAYLTAELYELHDREKFEIHAFDNGWDDKSIIRSRLCNAFDNFVDISKLSDAEAARKISDTEIDILINLNGYFGEHRMSVFAYRAAPIQVNYLGFPGTLGADYIDYIIADRIVIPEVERIYYSEKVVYLPDSYQVNDTKRKISKEIPTRAGHGLPESAFVFCNFNQSYKLHPGMFAVWMRLLSGIEGSVLWLLGSNEIFVNNLRCEAERLGIAGERLVFAPMLDLDKHLARLQLADLFVDSLPYNAHTTASDALWAGVPVLTCRGTAFPGRVAASLLSAIGLPELIAENMSDYEALALRLAHDPQLLNAIRSKLWTNRATFPLFDSRRFCRNIESAYIAMWDSFQRGKAPESFDVTASYSDAVELGN